MSQSYVYKQGRTVCNYHLSASCHSSCIYIAASTYSLRNGLLLDIHCPIRLAFGPSKIVQQGTAVELVIRRLNLLRLVDNKYGDAPYRQWSEIDLVPPSNHVAGVVDVECRDARERGLGDLLVDESLSRCECHRSELYEKTESTLNIV